MIEDAFYSLISNDSTITDIVEDRIYPSNLPDNPTLPALTYFNVGTFPLGQHGSPASLEKTRIQIDAYADTSRNAKLLIDTVRKAIESYRGTIGGLRIDTILVLDHAMGDYADITEDYRRTTEVEIWHEAKY